jgi:uncharacterized repeat protein (TIGR03803 family)
MELVSMKAKIVLAALAGHLLALGGAGRAHAEVTPSLVHTFLGSDGIEPAGRFIEDEDGNLYGVTALGGTGVTAPRGTVYRLTPGGDLTTLHTFDFQLTGDRPLAGLLAVGDDLYGTTRGTGAYQGNVFTIGRDGLGFDELHPFTGYFGQGDGSHPEAELTAGPDGNFYGTTTDGGSSNSGTIYRITPEGDYSIVHHFTAAEGAELGISPGGGLTDGGDGHLYGTARAAGPSSGGTVFRFTPGVGLARVHGFSIHGSGGSSPNSTLVLGDDGNLYGTTSTGGTGAVFGTAFRVSPEGDFVSLHAFDSTQGSPTGLTKGSDGHFYGTTSTGGANFLGTIFRVRSSGSFQNLHSFAISEEAGYSPRTPLFQASDGDFYGTTWASGTSGCELGACGKIFKVPGSGPGGILVPEPGAAPAGATAGLALGFVATRRSKRTA